MDILSNKTITNPQVTPSLQVILVNDYKSGKYTYASLAKKHNITKDLVYRYCNGIDKQSIKKELNDLYKQLDKNELLKELTRQGIDFKYIVGKLKKVLDSEDNKEILAGIDKYIKIQGYYSDKGESTPVPNQSSNLVIPNNDR